MEVKKFRVMSDRILCSSRNISLKEGEIIDGKYEDGDIAIMHHSGWWIDDPVYYDEIKPSRKNTKFTSGDFEYDVPDDKNK